MAIAKVTELSATSNQGFEDAIQQGLNRAMKTLRNVRSAWVKEMQVNVNGQGTFEYQVNIQVTFILED